MTSMAGKVSAGIGSRVGQGGGAVQNIALGDIPCDGCDLAQSAELNRRFNFFVLNLDRRPDKMACVREAVRPIWHQRATHVWD